MSKYPLVPLTEMADIFDHLREPVSQIERNKRVGSYPYYGATGQIGTIDGYRQDGQYVLLGEDGAPFFDPNKPKAYIVQGKCWVNNHAHVLKGKIGVCDDEYLCHALNIADYANAVTGSTRLKLPQSLMENLLIPRPTLSEQQRISKIIKTRFLEIEKTRNALQAAKEDIRLLLSKQQAMALELLEEVPRIKLDAFLSGIETGKSIKTTELPARKDELGVLKVSAISWDTFQSEEAKSVIGDYVPKEAHRVKKGDLIISRANTIELVGAVVLVDQDYPNRLLSDKTLRLVIKRDKVIPEYLLNVLKLPEARRHIEQNATGSSDSMRNISQKSISSTPIPDANKKIQSEIVDLMTTTKSEITKIEIALNKITNDLNLLPSRIINDLLLN